MNFDSTLNCEYCGGEARYIGTLALTDHFRCRQCGADHAVDAVRGKTQVVPGEGDAERFRAALVKHKSLIAPRGLP